jgi:hypothetical protein
LPRLPPVAVPSRAPPLQALPHLPTHLAYVPYLLTSLGRPILSQTFYPHSASQSKPPSPPSGNSRFLRLLLVVVQLFIRVLPPSSHSSSALADQLDRSNARRLSLCLFLLVISSSLHPLPSFPLLVLRVETNSLQVQVQVQVQVPTPTPPPTSDVPPSRHPSSSLAPSRATVVCRARRRVLCPPSRPKRIAVENVVDADEGAAPGDGRGGDQEEDELEREC